MSIQLIYTVKDRCRTCYTCVRECPVKAIKIINGQAEVLPERCIACGGCVQVCSQGGKTFWGTKSQVINLLASGYDVAACIAPSFPAEWTEIEDHRILVGMIRALGFDHVVEVSFGADLVAQKYKDKLNDDSIEPFISSDCPAIVNYIENYHPALTKNLAPIVSPMVAMARVMKKLHGEDLKIVFIGPCIAKKGESAEIDVGLTFRELREIFAEQNIYCAKAVKSDFDPPHSGKGAVFPVTRGMLQTVDKTAHISDGSIVVADGHQNFREAIAEFEEGFVQARYMELLACKGCIMGAGMSKSGRRYARAHSVSNYVKQKLAYLDKEQWKLELERFADLDLSQQFETSEIPMPRPSEDAIQEALHAMGKFTAKDHLNCGACGYATCEDHAIAINAGLAEVEMCLPYTIDKLHESVINLNKSNTELATARQALIQSEKLASMGQLSAGIAHELNNPLGVITMYSNILLEEAPQDAPIREDLKLIVEQADRCKNIVGGLLNFARKNQVKLTECDVVEFANRSLKSIVKPQNIQVNVISNITNTKAMIDTDQMMQVLTNLEKNAIEAMPDGGKLTITVDENEHNIIFKVSDTGTGISKENMDKIFTPFFTTKKIGKGTGLGLPLIYGIVKMHKGQISVTSNDNPLISPTGTTFQITIPRENRN